MRTRRSPHGTSSAIRSPPGGSTVRSTPWCGCRGRKTAPSQHSFASPSTRKAPTTRRAVRLVRRGCCTEAEIMTGSRQGRSWDWLGRQYLRDVSYDKEFHMRTMPTADVDERATIGAGTTIWHLAQVREEATI